MLSKEQYERYNESLKVAIYVLNTYKSHREECKEASKDLKELQNILKELRK